MASTAQKYRPQIYLNSRRHGDGVGRGLSLGACAFSRLGVVGVGGCFLFIWLEMRLEMVREPQTAAARVGRGGAKRRPHCVCG